MQVRQAQSNEMDAVRQLFREYQAWLNVDVCFQGFEEELASLPGRYASPNGAIFLALDDEKVIGCSAIRPCAEKPESNAELKRLFVHEDYRGTGLGRTLFNTSMEEAKAIGYSAVVLETLPIMKAAKSLYKQYGFVRTSAYFENADESVEFYRYQFD